MEEYKEQRDFEQEVRSLYEARPELRSQPLPEDVIKGCVEGKPLAQAYEDYTEDSARKQNEKAARQAPVRSVTRGGSVDAKPEDAFLRGFNEAW